MSKEHTYCSRENCQDGSCEYHKGLNASSMTGHDGAKEQELRVCKKCECENYYTKARTDKGLIVFKTKEDFEEWKLRQVKLPKNFGKMKGGVGGKLPPPLEKIASDVVKIILGSKATFFVGKGTQSRIPTAEWLYELKAEIVTNVEMYFYNLNKVK